MCLKVNVLEMVPKQWQRGLGEHMGLGPGLPYPEVVCFWGQLHRASQMASNQNNLQLCSGIAWWPTPAGACFIPAHSIPSPLCIYMEISCTHILEGGLALGRPKLSQRFRNDSASTLKGRNIPTYVAWMKHMWSGGRWTDGKENTAH